MRDEPRYIRCTPEIAGRICARITGGESLRQICASPDMPARSAVLSWLARDAEFARQYAAAILIRADHWSDEIVAIADSVAGSTHEDIAAARLRIATRQWLMTRLLPRRYGSRLLLAPDDAVTPEREERIATAASRVQALLDEIEDRCRTPPAIEHAPNNRGDS